MPITMSQVDDDSNMAVQRVNGRRDFFLFKPFKTKRRRWVTANVRKRCKVVKTFRLAKLNWTNILILTQCRKIITERQGPILVLNGARVTWRQLCSTRTRISTRSSGRWKLLLLPSWKVEIGKKQWNDFGCLLSTINTRPGSLLRSTSTDLVYWIISIRSQLIQMPNRFQANRAVISEKTEIKIVYSYTYVSYYLIHCK